MTEKETMEEETIYQVAPDQVTITSIRYGQLRNSGNYEHRRMEAEAQVKPGQDPAAVFNYLKEFVEEQLGVKLQKVLLPQIRNELIRLTGYGYGEDTHYIVLEVLGGDDGDIDTITQTAKAEYLLAELKKRKRDRERDEVPF